MDKFQQNMEAFHVPIASIIFSVSVILLVIVQIPTPEALNPFGCILGIIAITSGLWIGIGMLFSIE